MLRNAELPHKDHEQDKDILCVSPLLFSITLEVVANSVTQKKDMKNK